MKNAQDFEIKWTRALERRAHREVEAARDRLSRQRTKSAPEGILARIRGQYHEMSGLQLTLAQALRLWQLDAPTCRAALDNLVQAQPRAARTAGSSAPSIRQHVGDIPNEMQRSDRR